MPLPLVFIGMPAYRGTEFIAQSLNSIMAQSHADYRVLISIDGNDQATADKCRPFLADLRFAMEVQPARLGWDGNFNRLLSRADGEFFCYWQQDDLTTDDYLEKLVAASRQHPSAVCYYSDIQWFGDRTETYSVESVTGFPLDRALSIFETLNGIPNRGLIRRTAIAGAGPVAGNAFESAFEEYVWIAKLAREGNLHRVRGPTYFKRSHAGATAHKWLRKPRDWRRAVWLEFGLGMLETIWPLVAPADRRTAIGTTLDRLCRRHDARFMLYDGASVPFAFDFLEAALAAYPVAELSGVLSGDRSRRFSGEIAGGVIDAVADWVAGGKADPLEAGVASFAFGEAGVDLLREGWSWSEDWGTWSDARSATLRLPSARGERIRLRFTAFGRQGATPAVTVTTADGRCIRDGRVPANEPVSCELSVPGGVDELVFALPDAVSPAAIGFNADTRLLGVGLLSVELNP